MKRYPVLVCHILRCLERIKRFFLSASWLVTRQNQYQRKQGKNNPAISLWHPDQIFFFGICDKHQMYVYQEHTLFALVNISFICHRANIKGVCIR